MHAQDIWQFISPFISVAITLSFLAWWRRSDNIDTRFRELDKKIDDLAELVGNNISAVNEGIAELRGASHKHTGGPAYSPGQGAS